MPAYAVPSPGIRYTEADARLSQEIQILRWLQRNKKALYAPDEIMSQPPNSTPFVKTGSVQASSMVANTQYTMLEFAIPNGCYGVLKNRAHWVQGAGFVEGSGDLIWSVAIGDGWLNDGGDSLYSIGPDNDGGITASGGGLILRPNSRLTYYVTTGAAVTLDLAAVVLCRLRGWYIAANQLVR